MKKIFTSSILTMLLLCIGNALCAQVIIGTVSNKVSDKNKTNKVSAKKRGIKKVDFEDRNFVFYNSDEEIQYSASLADTLTKYVSVTPMAGLVSFPFKFRLQGDKDIETSLSLSGVAGVKFNFNKSSSPTALCLLIGLGPSSVPINKYNSSINDSLTLTQSAATVSLTGMFIWDKMQIAASFGMDKILNNRELKWSYQSKPWFSFGVGFSIFSSEEEDASE